MSIRARSSRSHSQAFTIFLGTKSTTCPLTTITTADPNPKIIYSRPTRLKLHIFSPNSLTSFNCTTIILDSFLLPRNPFFSGSLKGATLVFPTEQDGVQRRHSPPVTPLLFLLLFLVFWRDAAPKRFLVRRAKRAFKIIIGLVCYMERIFTGRRKSTSVAETEREREGVGKGF